MSTASALVRRTERIASRCTACLAWLGILFNSTHTVLVLDERERIELRAALDRHIHATRAALRQVNWIHDIPQLREHIERHELVLRAVIKRL